MTAAVVHEIGDFFLDRRDFIVPSRRSTRLGDVRLRIRHLTPDDVIPVDGLPTLAYASPIDPTQPTEYTSASLEMLLRPHQSIHSFRAPNGLDDKNQNHDLRSDDARALMTAGWTPSQEAVTRSLGAPKGSTEAQLRDSGKWETVRHHRVTLKAGETEMPRIELSYVARRAGALDNSPTKVLFAILMSITDAAEAGTLYDAVRSEHRALLPAEQARVRVRTRGGQAPRWD